MAPSWPLGAHAVAMLNVWVQPEVQAWLASSRAVLTDWKARQVGLLTQLNWQCFNSDANYFSARPPAPLDAQALRAQGFKLRETTSLGLSGGWRLSVQPPQAQDALVAACAMVREGSV